jgi:hypothetical protein
VAGKDMKYTITGNAKQEAQGFDALAKAAEKAGLALDGTQTTAQQLASVIAGMADGTKAELEGIASSADALRQHLGDAAEGMNLEEAVVKMRRFGLTFEEIEADAKALADALKHVDDVNRSIDTSPLRDVVDRTANVRAETDELTHSARGANSALANMVGNSAQDLGQVGGVVGSLGVGIGQMAEYAADATLEGEKLGSALKSMATIAGPVAALALATKAVGDYMAGIKAEKALRAELVDKFFDGFREGKTAVQIVNEELQKTGEITAQVSGKGGLLNLGTEAVDLAQLYRDAGISYEQFLADLTDPTALQRYRDQSLELIDTDNKRAVLFHDLADGLDDYQNGIGKAAIKQEELVAWTAKASEAERQQAEANKQVADGFGALADMAGGATEAVADAIQAAQDSRDAAQEEADALNEAADALLGLNEARRAAADSTLALRRANDEWSKTLTETKSKAEELTKVIEDSKSTDADKVSAYADLQDLYRKGAESAAAFADAEVQLARDQAEASGKTLTHTEELDVWNRKALAAAAAADGPLRDAITGYIADVNGIPVERVTDIVANADPNAIETAAQQLDDVSAARDTTVVADADTTLAASKIAGLNGTKITLNADIVAAGLRQKIANALGPFAQFVIPKAAKGMFVDGKPTLALIGETGADEVVLNLDDPASMRPLLAMPGVASRILGALSNGTVTPMANGGLVTSAPIGSGRSVELRGIDFGKALDTVFAGYTELLNATDALTAAQQRLAKAVEEGGRTLDANTDEGRANRDAVEAQWQAVQKLAEVQFDQGSSIQEVTAFLRSNIDALRGQLESLGLASDAIDDYLARLGATPDAINAVTAALGEQRRKANLEEREKEIAKQIRMEDYLYETQKINAAKYLEILRRRLAATEEWESEYVAILRRIDQVTADMEDSTLQGPAAPAPRNVTLPRPARADGKFTIADTGAIDARMFISGPVFGVEDLDKWADERDRKLAATISAGRRR